MTPPVPALTPLQGGARKQLPLPTMAFQEWKLPDGSEWASFHRSDSGYLLRFPGLADFALSSDGQEVVVWGVPGVSAATLEHLFLNQVQPLALSRQFRLVLHASAVEIGEQAVAFLGESGRGKSTLAAAFATSGSRFLTDDGLQLGPDKGVFLISPSHPSIRLWEDSCAALMPGTVKQAPPVDYTSKARLIADAKVAHCEVPRPLRAIYFLGDGTARTVSIEPLPAQQALMGLIKNCFLLDIEEHAMLRHHFGQLAALTRTAFFFSLDYPRTYERLPEVLEAVRAHAKGLVSATSAASA